MGTYLKLVLAAVLFAAGMMASQAAVPTDTTAKYMAVCQRVVPECMNPIIAALDAGAKSGAIDARCAANRPPRQAMALDIMLWFVGHHDLDAKPLSQSAVIAAERLWPCSRAR